jgi:drug/metabolite transporter (DMT)-like permease
MNAPTKGRAAAPLSLLLAAFACIYLIWGSTYLAIRFAIETVPPFFMVGTRFLLAGTLLYAWVSVRGEARRPKAREWSAAFYYGALFFLVGNGGVTWAEQRVPSGIVALLVAAVPIWITIFDYSRPGGPRPTALAVAGLVLGFGGIALLIGPGRSLTQSAIDPAAAVVMAITPMGWAFGTVHSRSAPRPPSLLQTVAMQMLGGGALSLIASAALGEWARVHPAAVSVRSLLALLYLILFGSIVAFSAYSWLLRRVSAARAGTYAFVNPIVAVFLGWALAAEPVTPRTLLAGAVVILGVVLVLRARAQAPAAAPTGDLAATSPRRPAR